MKETDFRDIKVNKPPEPIKRPADVTISDLRPTVVPGAINGSIMVQVFALGSDNMLYNWEAKLKEWVLVA